MQAATEKAVSLALEKQGAKQTEEIKKLEEEMGKILPFSSVQTVQFKQNEPPARMSSQFLKTYKEWIYANINAIAGPVANIELELYRLKKNDEPLEINEHEILELLYRVNDHMTKYDLIFSYIQHRYLLGEAAWYLVRKNPNNPKEKPYEIWPLRPDFLTIIPGDLTKNEFITRYEYK